ncbi:branched-chain amino acid transport system II carrier protein [Pareuzebyella sediminis]|uniref:branched-chain amino acid transport system II carrier protein n=1 Tax=Pareuzebyella sediminis TaxID=2607998 RepID=UPI0011EE0B30|nr:branched-chain amino acid transport system II carrier protein [Pareuzebyella sediminis]
MKNIKETLVTAFALFSLFFGAGNLILPPQLGFKAGDLWWVVALGFCLSAVVIPLLGILAHAQQQGTIYDFGKKVSPVFSLVYCCIVYAISIGLPSPRTASVTHEMAIAPFFDTPSFLTSMVYFSLVFIFVLNRSKLLDILGKILTPAIILILAIIMGVVLFSVDADLGATTFSNPFTTGILEGYQTFDAIGAVVVGAVIIVSINQKKSQAGYTEKKLLIRRAGGLAGLSLFLIYSGLIFSGATMVPYFDPEITRTNLLTGISIKTLGNNAHLFLSLLVGLACFTTAVGIVTGTADFVRSRCKDSRKAYILTAVVGCILGIVMGQFDVAYIIIVALPALMIIYPITIVLIILNVLPRKLAPPLVFKAVTVSTVIFSVPDFLGSMGLNSFVDELYGYIPLSQFSMGWVVPGALVFLIINIWLKFKESPFT